jgi:hypothetical protein
MRESAYQRRLIRKLKILFPGCIILKNDSSYLQGVPDLIILYGRCWGTLEVKLHVNFRTEPNQEYYVDLLNKMSFAAFIHPDNEEEVLDALQLAFKS